MIEPAAFVAQLERHGVSLFTGVPDSLLKQLGSHVMATLPASRHIIAANEGAAVGIAMGHHLRTGEVAVVYLQNSGFGNAVNPLLSLADPDVYGIPMLLVIGWRGQPGVRDEPQHVTQGRVLTALLDAAEIPWRVLPTDPAAAEEVIAASLAAAVEGKRPSVLLVEKDTFAPAGVTLPAPSGTEGLPSREEALIAAATAVGDGRTIVSTTGMLSRELFEHRQREGQDGASDFLTVGGMGHASAIALGIALRSPAEEVWCFDGDGALLMHMGGLAVIAQASPSNYLHVVFNNGVHDSVGGQPTAIDHVDIPAAALAMGYRTAAATSDLDDLPARIAEMRQRGGPSLLEIRVRPGNREGIGRPTRSPQESKAAFMAAIGAPAPSEGDAAR